MGMYTALSLGVELKSDTPQYVIDVLRVMVEGLECTSHPDHKFFNQCSRWNFMLRCSSYSFDWQTHWSFRKDNITDTYFLSGVSNFKNYDNEVAHFLSWLNEYIHPACAGVIGWTQYEEQMAPDLIARRPKEGTAGHVITFVPTEALVEEATS